MKLGVQMCKVVVKAYVTAGNDALRKIGSKHASLIKRPLSYLANFGESQVLTVPDIELVEQYLVQVWSQCKTTALTFDDLRVEYYKCQCQSTE